MTGQLWYIYLYQIIVPWWLIFDPPLELGTVEIWDLELIHRFQEHFKAHASEVREQLLESSKMSYWPLKLVPNPTCEWKPNGYILTQKKKKKEKSDDSKLIFPLLLKRYIYFVYGGVWMFYLYVYIVYTPYAWLVPVEVRRALIIWNWSYKWLQATMWVQKLNSSPLQESISVSSFLSFCLHCYEEVRVKQALKKVSVDYRYHYQNIRIFFMLSYF